MALITVPATRRLRWRTAIDTACLPIDTLARTRWPQDGFAGSPKRSSFHLSRREKSFAARQAAALACGSVRSAAPGSADPPETPGRFSSQRVSLADSASLYI